MSSEGPTKGGVGRVGEFMSQAGFVEGWPCADSQRVKRNDLGGQQRKTGWQQGGCLTPWEPSLCRESQSRGLGWEQGFVRIYRSCKERGLSFIVWCLSTPYSTTEEQYLVILC